MMDLQFTVQTKIQKPVQDVFDAIYNPDKIRTYFISGGASGPLDEGSTVIWKFNDAGEKVIEAPVKVIKMVPNQLIKFTWAASEGEYNPKTGKIPHAANYDNTVEMQFETLNDQETLLKISEGQWRNTEDGLRSSYQNCQGWTHMACCLKAYLEYGINLRKGAF
jgi:uncharacterized protein YndB with AHSA1/START domain